MITAQKPVGLLQGLVRLVRLETQIVRRAIVSTSNSCLVPSKKQCRKKSRIISLCSPSDNRP